MNKQSSPSALSDLVDQAEARTDQANARADEANLRTGQAEQHEEGMRTSESRYRRLFEAARDGILILDANTGMIMDVNPFLIELLGYSREVFLGKKIWELGFFKDIAANEAKFAELQAREYVRYENLPLESADGRRIAVEFVSNVYVESGHKVIQCNIRDITERKRHEEDLVLKEKAFSEISQGVLITDANRLIISGNQAFLAITGYSEEEIVGKNCRFLQGPQTDAQTVENIRNALNHEVEFHGEILNYRKDGTIFWNELSISPVFDQRQQVTHFVAVQRDITDRVEAHAKAKYEHDQLVQLLRAATRVSIIRTDPQGIITIFNEGARSMLGYDSEEVIGLITPLTYHLESEVVERGRELSALLGRPIEGFDVFVAISKLLGSETREWTYVRNDGSTLPVLLVVTCIRDDAGAITGFLGIATDLTQVRKAEEELDLSKRELEENEFQRVMIANSVGGVGIWEYELANNTLTWDDQMLALYGVARESFSGAYEAWTAGLHPDDRERGDKEFQMALSGGKEFNTEFRVCWSNGDIHHIRAIANVSRNENGLPTRMIGTNWDITEEKKQQLLLKETTSRALAADKMKTEFLGVMSHEFRTPLNGILGFSDILLTKRDLTPEARYLINQIASSGRMLHRILEDILDYSQLEGGNLNLRIIPFSLSDIAWRSIRLIEADANAQSLQLVVKIGDHVPGTVRGDPERIQQILNNLLRNAVKHTTHGGVVLTIELLSSNNDEMAVHFSVRDTGTGIPQEQRDKIFLPFVQLDSTLSRKFGGIGIGLALSKQLVENMGSQLNLESQVGEGSCFSFNLTFKKESSISKQSMSNEHDSLLLDMSFASRFPLTILAVEDNVINLEVLIKMLENLGYSQVVTANCGEDALEIMDKQKIDLVFMDLHMPGIDGIETTRRIRLLESKKSTQSPVPIIALTGNVSPLVREECFKVGMKHYIPKPFNIRSLAEGIMA